MPQVLRLIDLQPCNGEIYVKIPLLACLYKFGVARFRKVNSVLK